jgi:hypothetical protein
MNIFIMANRGRRGSTPRISGAANRIVNKISARLSGRRKEAVPQQRSARPVERERAPVRTKRQEKPKQMIPRAIADAWHDRRNLNDVMRILKMPPELVVRRFKEVPRGLERALQDWEAEMQAKAGRVWGETRDLKAVAKELNIPLEKLVMRKALVPYDVRVELKRLEKK